MNSRLLGRDTLDEDVTEAASKMREGFRFFNLKVATRSLDEEIATMHALRAALGKEIASPRRRLEPPHNCRPRC
jgi:L-alanine-DL-glutamate epimerase-like enolase superfamily enzyme